MELLDKNVDSFNDYSDAKYDSHISSLQYTLGSSGTYFDSQCGSQFLLNYSLTIE